MDSCGVLNPFCIPDAGKIQLSIRLGDCGIDLESVREPNSVEISAFIGRHAHMLGQDFIFKAFVQIEFKSVVTFSYFLTLKMSTLLNWTPLVQALGTR